MNVDAINALFEAGSAFLLTINLVRLTKDKATAGVSIIPTTWFSLWGMWNLVYYAKLHQAFSWVAGIAVFVVNTSWVVLAVYYKYRSKECRVIPSKRAS